MVLFYYTMDNNNLNNLYIRILNIFSNACEVRNEDDDGEKICRASKEVLYIFIT